MQIFEAISLILYEAWHVTSSLTGWYHSHVTRGNELKLASANLRWNKTKWDCGVFPFLVLNEFMNTLCATLCYTPQLDKHIMHRKMLLNCVNTALYWIFHAFALVFMRHFTHPMKSRLHSILSMWFTSLFVEVTFLNMTSYDNKGLLHTIFRKEMVSCHPLEW